MTVQYDPSPGPPFIARNILPHLRYLRYLLRHKWYVVIEGLRLGVPILQLLLHDWSKFLPSEWGPYVDYFYKPRARGKRDETGYYKPYDTGDAAFDFAWLLHQKRNPHHWQWWILPEDEGGIKVFPMSDRYRCEMLADWYGAGRACGTPDTARWYEAHKQHMQLHPETRAWVEDQLRRRCRGHAV